MGSQHLAVFFGVDIMLLIANLLKIRDPIDLTPWGTSFMSCANSNPMKLGKNDGVHLVLPPGMFD